MTVSDPGRRVCCPPFTEGEAEVVESLDLQGLTTEVAELGQNWVSVLALLEG